MTFLAFTLVLESLGSEIFRHEVKRLNHCFAILILEFLHGNLGSSNLLEFLFLPLLLLITDPESLNDHVVTFRCPIAFG